MVEKSISSKRKRIIALINRLITSEKTERIIALSMAENSQNLPINNDSEENNEQRIAQHQRNIEYLENLSARVQNQDLDENTTLALLKEIEGLRVKRGFATTCADDLIKDYTDIKRYRKKGSSSAPKHVHFFMRKKMHDEKMPYPLNLLHALHTELRRQLLLAQAESPEAGHIYMGEADETGKIQSPAIQQFIEESTASSREKLGDNPPALVDFRRDILIGDKKLPNNISAEELRKEIVDFLNTSETIRENPSIRNALCNFMLKNGQTLQTPFVLEYIESESAPPRLTINDERASIANNDAFYNWFIDEKGDLYLDLELHMKSVNMLDKPLSHPRVYDAEKEAMREIGDTEDALDFPTIMKYKASIGFDFKIQTLKDSTPTFFKGRAVSQTKETLAIPRMDKFEVIVCNDKIHYNPSLTHFLDFEFTTPKP